MRRGIASGSLNITSSCSSQFNRPQDEIFSYVSIHMAADGLFIGMTNICGQIAGESRDHDANGMCDFGNES
jgi:hypothetical protein